MIAYVSRIRYCCLIPLLMYCLCGSAQTEAPQRTSSSVRPYVFVSPLKAIDPGNQGLLYGGGLSLPGGIAIEVGHLALFSKRDDVTGFTSNRGNRFHFAVKKYLPLVGRSQRPYLQFRADLLNKERQRIKSFQSSDTIGAPTFGVYEDSIGVHRKITTLNAIGGVEFMFGDHFAIDVSAGFGIRYKNIRHTGRINPEDRPDFDDTFELGFTDDSPRKVTTFNIPLDIRLLYRF